MAQVPQSNITGIPQVTPTHLRENDPSVINRVFRLLAAQVQAVQIGNPSSTGITNVTTVNNSTTSTGSGGSSSGGSAASSTITTQGTHLQRLTTYPTSTVPVGSYYFETDRIVTYLNFTTPSGSQVWQYAYGIMFGILASRPNDLGIYDAGFLYYATDFTLNLTYRWSGTAWETFYDYEPILQDTHANRISFYWSPGYKAGTCFYETDRQLLYISQNSSGTVTVTGGVNVAWNSGNHFVNSGGGFSSGQWPSGTAITINGVSALISSVASATSLTLQSAISNAGPVSYLVNSGRWEWATGQMTGAWSGLPTDLGENDANLTYFDNVNSLHTWQWSGSGWTWGPADRHSGEIASFDADPGTGWHLANGSTVTKYASDGTRNTAFVLPDAREFYLKWSATYTGTGVAAHAPTITASSPTGIGNAIIVGTTLSGTANIGNDTDAGVNAVTVAGTTAVALKPHTHTDSGHIHGSDFTDAGHQHTVGNPTASTDGTPPTFAALPYYRL